MSQSGFVAGTWVHTDQGLIPIEQLEVGDRVLSMPEEGVGEKAYKRVVKTFKSPTKQKIMSPIEGIYCTDNHPFWVTKGQARPDGTWVSADQLNISDSLYQLAAVASEWDKEKPRYYAWKRDPYLLGGLYLIATDQDGIAIFLNKNDGVYLGDGAGIVDFRDGYPQQVLTNDKESYLGLHCYNSDIPTDGLAYKLLDKDKDKDKDKAEIQFYSDLLYRYILPDWADEDLDSNEGSAPFYDYVYNIEVEDYHTYFVGEAGIWVKSNL